jgi:type II secretory pathway pseudopilin PulG
MRCTKQNRSHCAESGYVLLAVMLTLTLMLAVLAIEAPRIAQQIKREREEELIHRGKDYATAIKRFVHKNGGRYPLSIDQLENTNHIRFLRKRYKDPITGESDWKLVHAGEAQIIIPTPKGQAGTLPTSSPAQNSLSNNSPGTASGIGAGTTGTGITGGGTGPGITSNGTPANQNGGSLGSLQTSNIGNGPAIGGGQVIGVASTSKKEGIKEFNDKDHYDEWLFVYDLRLEQSGGTGVTVAAPANAAGSAGATGTQAAPSPTPVQPVPAQTPPQIPN